MKKITFPCILLVFFLSIQQSNTFAQTVLLNDNFTTLSTNWSPVTLSGSAGSFSLSNGKLRVESNASSQYGVYNEAEPLSGHFYAEVDFTLDQNVGLALIRRDPNTGDPDLNNYTMLEVNTVSSTPVVSLSDKQGGVANVLDNTGKADKATRYTHNLTGNVYSIPYTSTNKKIRILRHYGERFFHFYYSVSKMVDGELKTGWMELAPSKEWGAIGASDTFYFALIANKGTVHYDNAYATTKPLQDQSDVNTGFKVTSREYNWSGYSADALVVTFGSEFPYASEDKKFVFSSLNNYVPVWQMSNKFQYCYEFGETWGGGLEGCFEPMSDKLLAYSSVEVVEDNAVRKVIHWSYVLINPDYKTPDFGQGTQKPEVDEYYTFYPDGTVIRRMRYTPKLDTSFRNWHEVSELFVIAGENTWPSNHFADPALTIWDLDQTSQNYTPTGPNSPSYNNSSALGPTALTAHFTDNNPDAFIAFSDDPSVPETYPGIKYDYKVSWHSIHYSMSHFPVNKEPYWFDTFKNRTNWQQQVGHASIMGVGIHGGTNWNSNYKVDGNGRRYREFISLIGLNDPGSISSIKDKTHAWVYPGTVTMDNNNSSFEGYEWKSKTYKFNAGGSASPHCEFTLTPQYSQINPTLSIAGYQNSNIVVKVDDVVLDPSQYKSYKDNNDNLLLWINGTYTGATKFLINTTGDSLTNIALNKSVTTSSNESVSKNGSYAVDGALGTRWSSGWQDNQNITVDLGEPYDLSGALINWEASYATAYNIEVSMDNINWSTVYSKTGGTGGNEPINMGGTGRYVRLNCLTRSNPSYGFSIYELELYGTLAGTSFPDPSETYYIENNEWDRRIGANGGQDPFSGPLSATGASFEWTITPSPTNGHYYIECVGGGARPRLRTDNTLETDMENTGAGGDWTRWSLTDLGTGWYLLTTLGGDDDFRRLQMTDANTITMRPTSWTGSLAQFKFVKVSSQSTSKSTLTTGINEGKEDNLDIIDLDLADKENPLSVYSILGSDRLQVNLGDYNEAKLQLYDLSGRLLYSGQLKNRDNSIDISRIKRSGLLVVRLTTDSGTVISKIILL